LVDRTLDASEVEVLLLSTQPISRDLGVPVTAVAVRLAVTS
jgi:hypothetical protein